MRQERECVAPERCTRERAGRPCPCTWWPDSGDVASVCWPVTEPAKDGQRRPTHGRAGGWGQGGRARGRRRGTVRRKEAGH
jgi:hypothetical protein